MAQGDKTDGKKGTKTDKFKRVPEGERILVELPLAYKQKVKGVDKSFTKAAVMLKEGTAKELNIEAADATILLERPNVGAKGTKSFMLVFDKERTVGGATVTRLAIPVPGGVKVGTFFKWAKTLANVTAIITPGGRRIGVKINVSDDT